MKTFILSCILLTGHMVISVQGQIVSKGVDISEDPPSNQYFIATQWGSSRHYEKTYNRNAEMGELLISKLSKDNIAYRFYASGVDQHRLQIVDDGAVISNFQFVVKNPADYALVDAQISKNATRLYLILVWTQGYQVCCYDVVEGGLVIRFHADFFLYQMMENSGFDTNITGVSWASSNEGVGGVMTINMVSGDKKYTFEYSTPFRKKEENDLVTCRWFTDVGDPILK